MYEKVREALSKLVLVEPATGKDKKRANGYLRGYRSLLRHFASTDFASDSPVQSDHAVQVGLYAAYGWMPTVLIASECTERLRELGQLAESAKALSREYDGRPIPEERLTELLKRIKSLMQLTHGRTTGLSKFLHFAAPNVFPIWDSKIRGALGLADRHATKAKHYERYVRAMHKVRWESQLHDARTSAAIARTLSLRDRDEGARPTDLRTIEMALFMYGQSTLRGRSGA